MSDLAAANIVVKLSTLFILLLLSVLSGFIYKSVLKIIFSIVSAGGFRKKKKQGSAVRVKSIILRATETMIHRRGKRQRRSRLAKVNLGFPRCKMNSKLDFREKRQGFDSKKPN